jgi:hypothetical protein
VTKNLNYRNNMLKIFPNLIKLDGKEITNEEREMILMDLQMGDDYQEEELYNSIYPNDFFSQKMNNNNGNVKGMQDKGLKRVNYVQIGLVGPNYMSPNMKNTLIPKKGFSLPQIKQIQYNSKPSTSESRKRVIFSGNRSQSNNINKNTVYNSNKNNNSNNFKTKDYYGYITKGLTNDGKYSQSSSNYKKNINK